MLRIQKVFDPIVKRTPAGLISCIGARLMGHLVCNCRQFRARPYLLCQMGGNYFWSSFLVFITLCFDEIFLIFDHEWLTVACGLNKRFCYLLQKCVKKWIFHFIMSKLQRKKNVKEFWIFEKDVICCKLGFFSWPKLNLKVWKNYISEKYWGK